MNNSTGQLLIGTSGYDYPEWKGVFYPDYIKRQDFLSYYATVFNALEINSTFYSMPDAAHIQSFIDRSQERLLFSIKANRLLTHEIGQNWKDCAKAFKKSLQPMANKNLLCSVLFQLPQSFHYTRENRFYLSYLINEFNDIPCVVEFRHKEWIKESVFEGLIKRNVSVAFCDMPKLKVLPNADYSTSIYSQFIGPQAYIRLHGRNANAWYAHDCANNGSARYDYEYSQEELASFVPVVKAAMNEGRTIQVFFNNHPRAKGAKNAVQLKELLAE